MDLTIGAVFLAGLLSFASPCVLPLLGSYLLFISPESGAADGVTVGLSAKNAVIRRVFLTLFFVLGFSAVFTVVSVLLYGVFSFAPAASAALHLVSGAVVILLGVNIIFQFIPFLRYESGATCASCTPKRSILSATESSVLHPAKRPRGALGSFIAGLAFGAGWTPCVGVILGSVLLMAANSGGALQAAFYLVIYSAGLGLPFIAASVFWASVFSRLSRIKNIMPVTRIVSGVFLVIMGVIIASGKSFLLTAYLSS